MGRHEINLFMRHVNMDAAAHAAYTADPAAFVARWEAWGSEERRDPEPHPRGGALTVDERRALVDRDFGVLYGMGAHPYLLWSFTEAVWRHELPRDEIVRRFRERAAVHGYPDPTT